MQTLMTLNVKVASLLLFFFISTHATEDIVSFGYGMGKTDPNSESISSITLSYGKLFDLDQKLWSGKIKIGAGVRAYAVSADQFQTNPDFNEVVEDLSSRSINAFIEGRFVWEKWVAGANLDLIGTTFGSDSRIRGTTSTTTLQSFNLFLFGTNDRGSLNSEFYAGYNFSPLSIKAGLSHMVTGFNGDVAGTSEKRQAFYDLFFISLSYHF